MFRVLPAALLAACWAYPDDARTTTDDVLDLDDIPVRSVSLDDLIALKRNTGRDRDSADLVHRERPKGSHG